MEVQQVMFWIMNQAENGLSLCITIFRDLS